MNSNIWWRVLVIVLFIVAFVLAGRFVYGQRAPLVPITPKTHTHLGNVIQVITPETFRIAGNGGFSTVRIRGINCSIKCTNSALCDNLRQVYRNTLQYLKTKLEKNNVLLECDGDCRVNKQKQKLHYVRLPDLEDLGFYLVGMGFCATLEGNEEHPRTEDYLKVQEEAKKAKLGMWK
jgi:endonuclease YncB( thermonuclease family)